MTTDRSTAADPQDHAARGRALIDRMRLGQADPLDVRRAAGLRYRPAVVACEMMGLEPEVGIEVPEACAKALDSGDPRARVKLIDYGIAVAACMEAIHARRGRINLARAILDSIGDDGAGLDCGEAHDLVKSLQREARGQKLSPGRHLYPLWRLYRNVIGDLEMWIPEATNSALHHWYPNWRDKPLQGVGAFLATTSRTHKPSTFASRLYDLTIRTLTGERESILEDW